MNHWLMKSEGTCYSIADLKRDEVTSWDGVRNYQARNFMQAMEVGDLVLFYHSNSKPSGVYGIARVVKTVHPDESQFVKKGEDFEPRATRETPVWYCVDVAYVAALARPVSLDEMKIDPELEGMAVRTKSRLSVQPVSQKHFEYIRNMR